MTVAASHRASYSNRSIGYGRYDNGSSSNNSNHNSHMTATPATTTDTPATSTATQATIPANTCADIYHSHCFGHWHQRQGNNYVSTVNIPATTATTIASAASAAAAAAAAAAAMTVATAMPLSLPASHL